MIPAGTYTARALGFEFGVSTNDKDFVAVDFEITGPDQRGERIIWKGYFSTEGAIRRSLESLRYAGWKGGPETIESLPGLGETEVELVIKLEEYNGKTYPKVDWVNQIGRGGVSLEQKMDPGHKRAFAARMRGHIAALGATASGPAHATAGGSGVDPDDDIGF